MIMASTVSASDNTDFDLSVSKETVKMGDTIQLTATKNTDDTSPVVFKINNKTITDNKNTSKIKPEKNKSTINYTIPDGFRAGQVNVTAVTTSKNKRQETTGNFNVEKINTRFTDITVYRSLDSYRVTSQILDDNNHTMKGSSKVAIKINGKTLQKDNKTTYFKADNGLLNATFRLDSAFSNRNITLTLVTGDTYSYIGTRHEIKNLADGSIEVKRMNINFINTNITRNKTRVNIYSQLVDDNNYTVKDTSKIAVKINSKTLQENGTPKYYYAVNGELNVTFDISQSLIDRDINVSLVTGDTYSYIGVRKNYTIPVSGKTTTMTSQSIIRNYTNITVPVKVITDNNKAVKNGNISVIINGKVISTSKINQNTRYITINSLPIGRYNITLRYTSTDYRSSENVTHLTVTDTLRHPPVIILNTINETMYSDNINITGKLSDNKGYSLTETPLTIKVNDKTYTTRTDLDGHYTFNVKTYDVGTNNVSVSFKGNDLYNASSVKTSFNVTAQKTTIYLDNIGTFNYSDVVTIRGRYTAQNGINLRQTPLNIRINSREFTVKTDDDGVFSLNIPATEIGKNNVSISYKGNPRFCKAEAYTSFMVVGKSDTLSLNSIPETQFTDNVVISGVFIDRFANAVSNTNLIITVNGKNYSVKTDSKGKYSLNYKTGLIGVNNVTVSYYGNTNYPLLKNMSTFNVTRKDTRLSVEKIADAKLGSNITIKGKYTDSSGNPLKLTTVSLLINDVRYSAKTDENGNYRCDYECYVFGTNTVEIYYQGTERYVGTSLNATFTVNAPDNGMYFKTRKTMVASVFASGSITSAHVTKWVNAGITDVYVSTPAYNKDTSLLLKTISLCKNTNIKVHAWIVVFRKNGVWDNSASHQKYMKNFINDVMHIKGVEGVCLDYIRYSGTNPKIVNTSVITNFLKDVNYMAKNIDKRMEVAACVMPEITNLKYYYGQDLQQMEKYVDYMVVMAYKNNYYQDTAWMVDVTKSLISKTKHAKVVTSIATYSDMYGKNYLSVSEIRSDIKAVMNAGSYGYSLFSKSTTPVYPKIF